MRTRYNPDEYTCEDGHILYSENVYIDARGYLVCKACAAIAYDAKKDSPAYKARMAATRRRYTQRKQAKAS